VGDDTDHPATNPQPLEGPDDQRKSVRIEGAETLVDEQAVEIPRADDTLNLVAELQGRASEVRKVSPPLSVSLIRVGRVASSCKLTA
jgi:hypothetical protein